MERAQYKCSTNVPVNLVDQCSTWNMKPKIQGWNSNKAYRVLPVAVLNYLTQDASISFMAKWIWIWLYNANYFDDQLSGKIPTKRIANELGKCTKTIREALKQLEEAGYIHREANYNDDQSFDSNTIAVTFPENGCAFVDATPDRDAAKKLEAQVTPINTPFQQVPQFTPKEHDTLIAKPVAITAPIRISAEESGDIIVTTQNKKSNNIVDTLKQKLSDLEIRYQEAKTIDDKATLYELMRERSSIEATLASQIEKIKRAEMQTNITTPQAQESQVKTEARQNNVKPSQPTRVLSEFEKKRIGQGIAKLGVDDATAKRFAYELEYSVTQDSLAKLAYPLAHIINIGLKRMREGNWATPYSLVNTEINQREQAWAIEKKRQLENSTRSSILHEPLTHLAFVPNCMQGV